MIRAKYKSFDAEDHGLLPDSPPAIDPYFRQNKIAWPNWQDPQIQLILSLISHEAIEFSY